MRIVFAAVVGLVCLGASREARSEPPGGLELRDGDRVVFLGGTFIERDQRYGYLETSLTIANPSKNLVFRNLGWSGDTVGGISRAGFDPPEAGFEQLRQQLTAVKPTVVIVGYGMADSFAGVAGLSGFEQGFNRLLNVIDSLKARVVLLSPLAHADLGRPLPDPAEHNSALERYRDVIRSLADERKYGFVDLFESFAAEYAGGRDHRRSLTDNGIHLTEAGYRTAAIKIAGELAHADAQSGFLIRLAKDGKLITQDRAHVSRVEAAAGKLRFEVIADHLPLPLSLTSMNHGNKADSPPIVSISGLDLGTYTLKIDGRVVVTADRTQWDKGVAITGGPDFQQAERLRVAINRKNDLFFYRWRPQNITYLFGFRKHEQGNNAVEIPQFDPLVADQEKIIAGLKHPVAHTYELTPARREVGQ